MTEYEDHPYSELFPLMEEAELGSLADDIEANGQQERIWLYEGKILDGRNRYRACRLKDIDPRIEEYKGRDALGFVWSKNVERRHLTQSQKAMAAARMATLRQGESKPANLPVSEHSSTKPANLPVSTQAEAAKKVGVSERSVRDAKTVIEQGDPELVKAVESGKATVSAAAKVAKLPKDEQREAVKSGTVKDKASAKRKAKAAEKQPELPYDEPDEQLKPRAKPQKTPNVRLKDGLGNLIPDCVADTFGDPMLTECVERINAVHKEVLSIESHVKTTLSRKHQFWPFAHYGECLISLNHAADRIAEASAQLSVGIPFKVCPECSGQGCKDCKDSGTWTRHMHESGVA